MKTGKKPSHNASRVALTSAVAGATLLGCAAPAMAEPAQTNPDPPRTQGVDRHKTQRVIDAEARVDRAEIAVAQAQTSLDTARTNKSSADAALTQATQDQASKQTAYEEAQSTPAVTSAKNNVANAVAARKNAQKNLDQARQKVTRLEGQEGANNPTIVRLTRERDQARAALTTAEATTAQKQAAATEADQLKTQGTAGYFKHKGATGAFKILTDAGSSGKTFQSIHLGQSGDATSMDKMLETLRWLNKANQLRQSEGKPELKVSDSLMAMAQADADWTRDDRLHGHAAVFPIGENVAYSANPATYDPFNSWYTEEKRNKANGTGQTGHYDNIVNAAYTITGFAVTCTSTNVVTMSQTFLFSEPLTRVTSSNPLWAGNQNATVSDYFQDVNNYLAYLNNAQSDLTTAQAAEAAARTNLTTRQNDLNTALASITPSPSLTAARTALAQAQTDLATAQTTLNNAQAALAAAQAAVASDPGVVAALNALNAANTRLASARQTSAQTNIALANAQAALNNAVTERTNAYQNLAQAIAASNSLVPGTTIPGRPGTSGSAAGSGAGQKQEGKAPEKNRGDDPLASTGSDSMAAIAACVALCAAAMGTFGIRRRLRS